MFSNILSSESREAKLQVIVPDIHQYIWSSITVNQKIIPFSL
jgi:hypothetical protein